MDDDEFGGFEAAEEEQEAQPLADGVQASPSPWAYFPGQNQPDLIRPPGQAAASSSAEIRPNVQDPLEPNFPQGQNDLLDAGGAIGGVPAASAQNAPAGASVGLDWEADFKEFDSGPDVRSLSEQVLEPHFGSIKSDKPVPEGVLDLVVTHRQTNRQQDNLDLDLEPDVQNLPAANEMPALEERAAASQSDEPRENGSPNEGEEQIDLNEVVGEAAVNGVEEERGELQGQLRQAEEEKSRLQKELDSLISSNHLLEGEIRSLRSQLEHQRSEFDTVQQRHLADLEEMRGAGQGALAIIVEDYKELCKVAVLEQQNSSQAQLREAIEKEQDKWREIVRVQQEEFKSQLEEERQKMAEEIRQSLEAETTKHKERITTLVSEEKKQLEDEMRQSLEKMKQEADCSISETFKSERQQWSTDLEGEKGKLQSLLEEEREGSRQVLAAAIEEESHKCQECVKAAIKEERSASEKALKEAVQATQEQIKVALEEQKQRDLVVKKKSLHSVDLLLESARQQLKLLLERDDTQSESSRNDKHKNLDHGDSDNPSS